MSDTTPLDLDAIRARYDEFAATLPTTRNGAITIAPSLVVARKSARDVAALLDELARVTAERDRREEKAWNDGWAAADQDGRWRKAFEEQVKVTRQLDDLRMREIGETERELAAARKQAEQAQAERDTLRMELSHPAVAAVAELVKDRNRQYRRAEAAHDAKDEANRRWLAAATPAAAPQAEGDCAAGCTKHRTCATSTDRPSVKRVCASSHCRQDEHVWVDPAEHRDHPATPGREGEQP